MRAIAAIFLCVLMAALVVAGGLAPPPASAVVTNVVGEKALFAVEIDAGLFALPYWGIEPQQDFQLRAAVTAKTTAPAVIWGDTLGTIYTPKALASPAAGLPDMIQMRGDDVAVARSGTGIMKLSGAGVCESINVVINANSMTGGGASAQATMHGFVLRA